MTVNVNVMIKNVIQIKSGIKNFIRVSVKIYQNMYAKKIMFVSTRACEINST